MGTPVDEHVQIDGCDQRVNEMPILQPIPIAHRRSMHVL